MPTATDYATLQALAEAIAEDPYLGPLTLEEAADWRLCARCRLRWIAPGKECDCDHDSEQ